MNDKEVLTHLEQMYDDGKRPEDGVVWLHANCSKEQAQRVVDKKVHDLSKALGMI